MSSQPIINSTATSLCHQCSEIFRHSKQLSAIPLRIDDPGLTLYRHHEKAAQVFDTARAGCHLCKLLLSSGFPSEPLAQLEPSSFSWAVLEHPIIYYFTLPRDRRQNRKRWWNKNSNLGLYNLSFELGSETRKTTKVFSITHITDPAREGFGGSTNSPQTWRMVSDWIDDCLKNHKICGQDWYAKPTRLLDVKVMGSQSNLEDGIKVVEFGDADEAVPYLTLSHCWGTHERLKLLTTNIDQLKQSVSWDALTKTFQDAVQITRKLNFRYLWIDSLCIIQDSGTDWQIESSKMGDIYMASFLNIAATHGNDGRDGCFIDRDPVPITPLIIQTSWNGHSWYKPHNNIGNDSKYLHSGMVAVYNHDIVEAVESAPLNRRGWVIQERLLSPRILHFSSQQLFWECRYQMACETMPKGLPMILRERGLSYGSPSMQSLTSRARHPDWEDDHESLFPGYQYWGRIVTSYTGSNLTREEDKLVAIKGIIDLLWMGNNDECLAGIWKKYAPYQLLWRVAHGEVATRPIWRAPTWSWASLNGRVVNVFDRPRGQNFNEEKDIMVKILEISVEDNPTKNAMLGAAPILGGLLKLKGELAKGVCRLIEPDSGAQLHDYPDLIVPNRPSLWAQISESTNEEIDAKLWFDIEEEIQEEEVYLIAVRKGPGMRGLILRPSNSHDEAFDRIGVFEVQAKDWTLISNAFTDAQRLRRDVVQEDATRQRIIEVDASDGLFIVDIV